MAVQRDLVLRVGEAVLRHQQAVRLQGRARLDLTGKADADQAELWERLGRQAVAELLEQPATQALASPLNPAEEADGGRRGFVRVSAAETPVWTE